MNTFVIILSRNKAWMWSWPIFCFNFFILFSPLHHVCPLYYSMRTPLLFLFRPLSLFSLLFILFTFLRQSGKWLIFQDGNSYPTCFSSRKPEKTISLTKSIAIEIKSSSKQSKVGRGKLQNIEIFKRPLWDMVLKDILLRRWGGEG